VIQAVRVELCEQEGLAGTFTDFEALLASDVGNGHRYGRVHVLARTQRLHYERSMGPPLVTDHLSKYTDFFTKHQILPLDDLIKKDNVDTSIYQPGLADLWVGSDGHRYGLPKDWDTVAIFYNKLFTDTAGLTADQLNTMAWNPSDGGTYEKALAHLTVDKSGKRGDEPGFDKHNVKTYGLWLEGSGSGFGQTQWSTYALSDGWTATNKNPWGTTTTTTAPSSRKPSSGGRA
jgi:ABC-type glycerol-3-phosphate transport system substrate-binding protein